MVQLQYCKNDLMFLTNLTAILEYGFSNTLCDFKEKDLKEYSMCRITRHPGSKQLSLTPTSPVAS